MASVPPAAAALPRVLIVGDSVSLGFTPFLAELLADEATVERPPAELFTGGVSNCGDTERGAAEIASWLGRSDEQWWDVVHFQFGLHDICYRRPAAESGGSTHGEWRTFRADRAVAVPEWEETRLFFHDDKDGGQQSVPLPRYVSNLRSIVAQLRAGAPAAELCWASTTMVPPDEPGRKAGEEIDFNAAAAEVMAEQGVAINDLHRLTSAFEPALFRAPGDVHYTDEGSLLIAQQVAAHIREALARKKMQQQRQRPTAARM